MKKKLFIILFIFLILSCGKKTPPLPIEKSIPKEPSLEIRLTPQGANLFIYLPTETQGGFPLVKIKKLIIEKTEIPIDIPKAKAKTDTFKLSVNLHSAGNLFVYPDYNLKHRHKYIYKIKIIKDFIVETPFTESIEIFWHNPPNFPQEFKVNVLRQDSVLITWKRPEKDIYGLYLEGEVFYEIEKITEKERKIIEIKGKEEYFDEIKSGVRTCYNIRAILNFRGTFIPGPKTPDICVK